MRADYFSVDSILAENQKIQCTFRQKIPDMGHLGGGSENDIAESQKVQLPVWLAYTILYSQWADFNIPAPFSQRVRNALRAEASSVRLSNLVGAGGTWYGFGKTIMDLVDDEQATELSQILTSAFRSRLVEVVDQAHHFASLSTGLGSAHKSSDTAQVFREGLDATERDIFALAQGSARRTKRWYEEGDSSRH